ncbi:MAG: phosphatidylcholine synthase [Legionellales bacterium RIFCSPHIGHO2_12_FULL_37_14]|nr:MAG: phosphatidylcholine synthase [Legionellales bacterium RIFCSPHIGHO2_12_FULL_37_14]
MLELKPHPIRVLMAWLVHAFTATAACAGMMTLINIYQHQYVAALWFMAIAVVIDAVDGTLARMVHVKTVLPNIDGALLDNMVDYLNYVITPCFFFYIKPDMLPTPYTIPLLITIIMTSAYQFCQIDAKTPDHFFKGFPCYWNIVLFYMFIFNTAALFNLLTLLILCILIFVPVKYVYPSRLDYLTESRPLKICMHVFSCIYGISSACLLWQYPDANSICVLLSLGYVVLYLSSSIYRTYYPMIKSRIIMHRA